MLLLCTSVFSLLLFLPLPITASSFLFPSCLFICQLFSFFLSSSLSLQPLCDNQFSLHRLMLFTDIFSGHGTSPSTDSFLSLLSSPLLQPPLPFQPSIMKAHPDIGKFYRPSATQQPLNLPFPVSRKSTRVKKAGLRFTCAGVEPCLTEGKAERYQPQSIWPRPLSCFTPSSLLLSQSSYHPLFCFTVSPSSVLPPHFLFFYHFLTFISPFLFILYYPSSTSSCPPPPPHNRNHLLYIPN